MVIYDYEKNIKNFEEVATNSSADLIIPPDDVDLEISKAAQLLHPEDRQQATKNLPEGIVDINAILVSTNWNGNDDVFTPKETAGVFHTARGRPANINHDMGKVIGFTNDSYIVDKNYKWLSSFEAAKADSFHILVKISLWQTYFEKLIQQYKNLINNNKLFVSMECKVKDFGFALRESSNTNNIMLLERNPITAKLTPALKVFGGSGKVTVDGKLYEIGRWCKDIYFSGVAFTTQPANKESIIFQDYIAKASQINFEVMKEISSDSCVYNNNLARKPVLWPI